MDTRQSTLVIVETLSEGEDGERVILRCIAFDDTNTAVSATADEPRVDRYRSAGDVPTVLLERTTRS